MKHSIRITTFEEEIGGDDSIFGAYWEQNYTPKEAFELFYERNEQEKGMIQEPDFRIQWGGRQWRKCAELSHQQTSRHALKWWNAALKRQAAM